jgi:ATP-binding cassette subfamily B protein
MIQQMGRLFQQVITTLSFQRASSCSSPWLVLLLLVGVLPSFLRRNPLRLPRLRQELPPDPAKRQMDYLRQVAGSREGAKELKLFNLNKYLHQPLPALADQIYKENVDLSRRKLIVGRPALP